MIAPVEGHQVLLFIDDRFRNQANYITGASSGYGNATYWLRVSCSYNFKTRKIEAFHSNQEGNKSNTMFKVFYR